MLEYSRKALLFSKNKTRIDLETDEQLMLALVRIVEVIGEAASKTSQDMRERNPLVPWADIISTRNRLVHAYFDVDLDVLWEIVRTDLPPLVEQLQKITDEAEQQRRLF